MDALPRWRGIDQHAAGDEGAYFFDAKLLESGAGRDVVHLEAIVERVFVGLVGKTVEPRPHLADLRNHPLFVAAATVGAQVISDALGEHLIAPRARDRYAGVERMAQLDDFARLDKLGRIEHAFRPHEVAGTTLVAGPPLGRTACAVGWYGPARRLGDAGRRGEKYRCADDRSGDVPDAFL
jgi:hypothetical protein